MSERTKSGKPQRELPDSLRREIAIVRDMMLTVHYFEEASWLVAAVAFPGICRSATAQQILRNSARIAWQFGFPSVSHWLNTEVLTSGIRAAEEPGDNPESCSAPSIEPA
jgi:hypothetical protein